VSNDCRIISGSTSEGTSVPNLFFDVADDGTFRALTNGEDVPYYEGGFFAAVDESTGMEAFGGDESFFTELVAVGVTEDDACEGCTATGVVDNFFYDTADITIALCEIQVTKTSRGFSVVSV
jgi:hypothetical protein